MKTVLTEEQIERLSKPFTMWIVMDNERQPVLSRLNFDPFARAVEAAVLAAIEKPEDAVKDEAWYILYDGQSADGRGSGDYCGRTTDASVARSHHEKCKSSPYNTGRVVEVTDEKETLMRDLSRREHYLGGLNTKCEETIHEE